MPRLFTAVPLPEPVRQHLALLGGGVPGARWEPEEKLHLTLRFIGEIDGGTAKDVTEALATVRFPAFTLVLRGCGHFPPRGQPRTIWIGVQDARPLQELHAKIDRVLTREGLEPDRRKFAPHVTLARLRNAPERKVAEFEAYHNLFVSQPIDVEAFSLMSSVRNDRGSKYRVERIFPSES